MDASGNTLAPLSFGQGGPEMPKIIIVLLALTALTLAGCSTAHLERQADLYDQAAVEVDKANITIDEALAKYDAGLIEDNQLLDIVRAALPDSIKPKLDQAVSITGSVREAVTVASAELPDLADLFESESAKLRADAAANDSKFNNTIDALTSGAKTFGGVIGVLGVFVGALLKKKGDDNLSRMVFAFDNAQKGDPELKARIQANGSALRTDMGEKLSKKISTKRIIRKA